MQIKPNIRSPTYCHAIGPAEAATMLNSHVVLFLEEKLVVDLDESSDARTQEKSDRDRPLLRKMVKEGIDAIGPMLDQGPAKPRHINSVPQSHVFTQLAMSACSV